MKRIALLAVLACAVISPVYAADTASTTEASFVDKVIAFFTYSDAPDGKFMRAPAREANPQAFPPPGDKPGGGLPGGLCYKVGSTLICQVK